MRDYSIQLPGRVAVANRSDWSYEGLFVRADKFGISIPRLKRQSSQMIESGPHFSIECVNATFLINAIGFIRGTSLGFSMAGDYLGYIQTASGYQGADIGENIPISSIEINAHFQTHQTDFMISGSCKKPSRKASISAEPLKFEIWFSVSDQDLSNFFDEDGFIEAFKRNRDSYTIQNRIENVGQASA